MRYIGSKVATLPWITQLVEERAPTALSLCDPFAGTCTVARHFKARGMRVVTGDLLRTSYILQVATLGLNAPPAFDSLSASSRITHSDDETPSEAVLAYLQGLEPADGYFSREFGVSGAAGRMFFSDENAGQIDSVATCISSWRAQNLLDEREEAYLRATLILAADKVANTAGTYYAHLKSLGRKALKPITLQPPPITSAGSSGGCHNADALGIVSQSQADILYLDPPYNERDYACYYHLPETLARGDTPEAFGKSGVPRGRSPRSPFYRTAQASDALSQLCAASNARHIIVHYTTEGIIPHSRIVDSLRSRGNVRFEDKRVRAYSSDRSQRTREAWHRIYWCDVSTEEDVHDTP